MLQRANLGGAFARLWAAGAVANLGDGVTVVSAPLLAAALTSDPLLVAGLTAAHQLPQLLFPLLGGVLVDRLDRRRVIAALGLCRAALIGALGTALLLDAGSIPLLYAVFFLLGAAETVVDTASFALLPSVVPREDLPRANARLAGTTQALNAFVGPPLGGFLFALAAAAPFLAASGAWAAAAALLLTLRGSFRAERAQLGAPTTFRGELAEGVRALWKHRVLRNLALILGMMNLTFGAWYGLLVLLARERFSLGPEGYSLLISTWAAGGLLGSVVASWVIARLGVANTLRAGLTVEACTPAVLALAPNAPAAGAMLALFGVHAIVWGVAIASLRQTLAPARLLGRVNSAYSMLGNTVFVGALLGGTLGRAFGVSAPFWFAAGGIAALCVLVWRALGEAGAAAAAAAARDAEG